MNRTAAREGGREVVEGSWRLVVMAMVVGCGARAGLLWRDSGYFSGGDKRQGAGRWRC
jgi:hypothetical protein